MRLSDFINNYKTVTARLLRKEYAAELTSYYREPYFWSGSYFVSTLPEVNDETIRCYIENQNRDDDN